MKNYISSLFSNPGFIIGIFLFIVMIVVAFFLIKYFKSKKVVFEDISDEVNNDYIRKPNIEEKQNEIEVLLDKMEKALESEKSEVEIFEDEQEEKAVISYQELIEAVNKNKQVLVSSNELKDQIAKEEIKSSDIVEETIEVIEDVIDKVEEVSEVKDNNKKENEKKKFKSTDFISPVYGIVNSVLDYPKVITKNLSYSKIKKKDNKEIKDSYEMERMLNIEPISDDIKRNDEFLQALKDFRKNLE